MYPLMRNNITREDLDSVISHLQQDDPILTNGPNCENFEKEWSEWLGVKHSVFVNSGSSSNLLSMTILKMEFPEGGEIIVPPLTWVSDIASVIQTGFSPVFVDINPETLAMDTEKIISKINANTRAVFLTHVQGFNGLTDRLLDALEQRGIRLIEDVCESHGALHNGKKLGCFGQTSNFSFYYAHHMSTIEGGMVCTNDDNIYDKLLMLRSHGMVRELKNDAAKLGYQKRHMDLNPEFIFSFPSYNMRNNEIGAILGRNQLKRLNDNIRKRNEHNITFLSNINPSIYRTDFEMSGSSNYAFNLVLKSASKELMAKLCSALDKAHIEYRRGSAGGGNQLRQPYLKNIIPDLKPESFPEVEHIHFFGMYIGNFPDLSKDEVLSITEVINSVI